MMECSFRKGGNRRAGDGVCEIMRKLLFLVLLIASCWPASVSMAVTLTTPTTPSSPSHPSTQPAVDEKSRDLLDQWRDRFAAEHLSYLVAPPFVLAGNGGIVRLRKLEAQTIRDATDALQTEFFDAKPTEPVLILLLESDG